jgi:hypothetical protein
LVSFSVSPGADLLAEAMMSYARPMHPQQLPTVGSVAWLIIAVVFIMLVVIPGALALLALLLSDIIFHLM